MPKPRLKTVRPDRRSYRKVTLLIPADVDFRLTVLAKSRNVDRSALAAEALAELVRHVEVRIPA